MLKKLNRLAWDLFFGYAIILAVVGWVNIMRSVRDFFRKNTWEK